jgi:hypothetical protein
MSNKIELNCSCVCYCYINLSLIAGGLANGKRKRKYASKGLSSLDTVGIESVGFLKRYRRLRGERCLIGSGSKERERS